MGYVIDTDSDEFKGIQSAWTDALKVLDTKLNAYYLAVAALENNTKYSDAAKQFKETLSNAENRPSLKAEMDEKYRQGLLQFQKLSSGLHPAEAVRSWFSKFQQTHPQTPPEVSK